MPAECEQRCRGGTVVAIAANHDMNPNPIKPKAI